MGDNNRCSADDEPGIAPLPWAVAGDRGRGVLGTAPRASRPPATAAPLGHAARRPAVRRRTLALARRCGGFHHWARAWHRSFHRDRFPDQTTRSTLSPSRRCDHPGGDPAPVELPGAGSARAWPPHRSGGTAQAVGEPDSPGPPPPRPSGLTSRPIPAAAASGLTPRPAGCRRGRGAVAACAAADAAAGGLSPRAPWLTPRPAGWRCGRRA